MEVDHLQLQLQSSRVVKPKSSSITGFPAGIVELSTCDLAIPNVYAMAIYAFKSGPGDESAVEQLEKGLELVLCDYPEWAGRLAPNSSSQQKISVQLTDQGVALNEATLNTTLEELMPFNPSPALSHLVPDTNRVQELLLIQVTRLSCGGTVVGVAWHHRLADGQAFFTFMDNWSRRCRGDPISSRPFRDRTALTARPESRPLTDDYLLLPPPSPSPSPSPSPPPPPSSSPLLAARKLHFNPELLRSIKSRASHQDDDGDGDSHSPVTTFESLTAHLWRCITMARGLTGEVRTQIMIPMNGRSRLKPALPESYFGNATFMPSSGTLAGELVDRPLSHAAQLVHGAIAKADDGYLRGAIDLMEVKNRVMGGDLLEEVVVPASMSPHVVVTSWVRFPLYEVDFGWGAPFYVGNVLDLFEGIMILLPSYTRDGSIDAVVALFQPEIEKLEQLCYTGLGETT